MNKLSVSVLFFLLFATLSKGQNIYYKYDDRITVTFGKDTLQNAWTGGFTGTQWNTIDLNQDNQKDLVIYDRFSGKLLTFLWHSNGYQFAPEYAHVLPEEIQDWLILRDYDKDGKKDIFTRTATGIRVFHNQSERDDFQWEEVANPVLTEGSAGMVNISVSTNDIPNIKDMDGDGDLDILVFNDISGGVLEFHRNFAGESGNDSGPFAYKRVTRKWGDFEECGCDKFVFGETCNGTNNRSNPVLRQLHAGGKTLLTTDLNNDDQVDLLYGDEFCNKLNFLANQGTGREALFKSFDNNFPQNTTPAHINFPASFYEDFDHDGTEELIVTTNARENSQNQLDLTSSAWFYENTGTSTQPKLSLKQKNFLQDEMIDFGENAVPAFVDYDGDGDQDLFIGNRGGPSGDGYYGRIVYFENTGSQTLPNLVLRENDFLNLRQQKIREVRPYFTDINNDGAKDLIVSGISEGNGSEAGFIIYPNEAASGEAINLRTSNPIYSDFTFHVNDHPAFGDINNDGSKDILLGKNNGALHFYSHTGTNNNPSWSLQSETFLGINPGSGSGNLSPFLADINNNGRQDLLTTEASGIIRLFFDFEGGSESAPSSPLQIKGVKDNFHSARVGQRSWPVTAPLFGNDQQPAIIIGARGGGLQILNPTFSPQSPREGKIKLFPNPSNHEIRVIADGPTQYEIYTIAGKLIMKNTVSQPGEPFIVETGSMQPGAYVIRVKTDGNKVLTEKFIVY